MRMKFKANVLLALFLASALHFACAPAVYAAGAAESLVAQLDESPHLQRIAFSSREVVDHPVGLGAIQKVGGDWRFEYSERLGGTLLSYTWQVGDGHSAAEVMAQLQESVLQSEGATVAFSCDGRACGRAVEWANTVFNQRVLFGRGDKQQYRVFAFEGGQDARLIAYGAERTADRQYLHVELLLVAPK